MKLEFLPDGSDDCPLVRAYDFLPSELARFAAALSALASREPQRIAVHELSGVEAVFGCRLFLRSGSEDRGLVQLPTPAHFECILTPDGWCNVSGLTEAFVHGGSAHQWLVTYGDAKWLLSRDGQW